MPSSCKSMVSTNVTSNTKPMNIFYVWYAELCRRCNSSPLTIVKPTKPKNDTVLDFTADRIKAEEWTPILNALRLDTSLHVIAIRSRVVGCKFLYEANTEDRVRRMKRRCAPLWTDYILRSLMRSLSCCAKNTQVLSSLELDGLPLSGEYLEMLLQTLRNNRTIKMLSFKHCPINDGGCQQLCIHLRFMPNVEVLNLSSCNLSSISGQHIARVIKHQQINRYCESWHNSLRYEDPIAGIMAGLKRITLNNNPGMGDEGLSYILDELDDDLWIKAIDMQKCNITEKVARRLVDVVEYSRSLEVADFRDNEHLSFAIIEKILEVLEKKQQFGHEAEYQWCGTATTLYDFAYQTSRSNISGSSTVIQKSRSAPLRQIDSVSRTSIRPTIRRTKTLALIDRKPRVNTVNLVQPNKKQLDDAKKKLSELSAKLQQEISKRKETEKINNELQQRLEEIRKLGNFQISEQQNKLSSVIRMIEDLGLNNEERAFPTIKEALAKKDIKEKPSKPKTATKTQTAKKRSKSPKKVAKEETSSKRPLAPAKKVSKEQKSTAQNIFEKFLSKDNKNDEVADEDDIQVDNVLSYYYDSEFEEDKPSFPNDQLMNAFDNGSPLTGSTASLERFLQEMNVVDEDLQIETNLSPNETIPRALARGSSQDPDKNNLHKFMVKVS